MVINDEWLRCNPFNDILSARENLLWIGRPNEEIYVRGEWNQRGVFKYWALSVVIFVVATICLFTSRSVIPALFLTVIVSFTPLAAYVLLGSKDYKRAPWYAFSDKRIFLAAWDHEDNELAMYSTELSNLKEVFVKAAKQPLTLEETDKTTGTLTCVYRRRIPKRASDRFTFYLIKNPAEVQALLLDTKDSNAASV